MITIKDSPFIVFSVSQEMTRVLTPQQVRPLHPEDYQVVRRLWEDGDGVVLRAEEDSEAGFTAMLRHNPGLCLGLIIPSSGALIGAVLAGFDGRRAYVYHFVIDRAWRRQGCGRQLADALAQAFQQAGIFKAHVFVLEDNLAAQAFWGPSGWTWRHDLRVYSRDYR